jgi:hypothetical protein
MMSEPNDGGPAFPVNGPNGDHPGMSYRQWLVSQVLPVVAERHTSLVPEIVLAIVDSVIKAEKEAK